MSRIMYDSTDLTKIPVGAEMVAWYPHAFPSVGVSRFTNAVIVSIDQKPSGPNPECDVFDIEPGAGRIARAPGWLDEHKARTGTTGTLYSDIADLAAIERAVQGKPHYRWIANPTGTAHQYPGADATQYGFFGIYDKSLVTNDNWPRGVVKPPPPAHQGWYKQVASGMIALANFTGSRYKSAPTSAVTTKGMDLIAQLTLKHATPAEQVVFVNYLISPGVYSAMPINMVFYTLHP